MSKLAYFNPQDGRVLQWIDTEAMSYNLPDASMIHTCTDAEWELRHQGEMMVKNGAVVPYAAPAPDPLQVKSAKWEAIKSERDRRKAGGVKVGEKWFHSDDGSRIQQMGLVMMGANLPAGLQWKTMDGSFITMTQTLASQVFQAVAASDQAFFAAAETHRVKLNASADPASYDFSTGWPKIYGE